MAMLIPADITQQIKHNIQPANGKKFSIMELRRHIDAQIIEIIPTNDGKLMVIDEEGKCVNHPVKNVRAAEFCVFASAGDMRRSMEQLAKDEGVTVIMAIDLPDDDDAPADWIAGDVLICNSSEIE